MFGEGALLKAYEDLKEKLEKEGLFDQSTKKEKWTSCFRFQEGYFNQ